MITMNGKVKFPRFIEHEMGNQNKIRTVHHVDKPNTLALGAVTNRVFSQFKFRLGRKLNGIKIVYARLGWNFKCLWCKKPSHLNWLKADWASESFCLSLEPRNEFVNISKNVFALNMLKPRVRSHFKAVPSAERGAGEVQFEMKLHCWPMHSLGDQSTRLIPLSSFYFQSETCRFVCQPSGFIFQ